MNSFFSLLPAVARFMLCPGRKRGSPTTTHPAFSPFCSPGPVRGIGGQHPCPSRGAPALLLASNHTTLHSRPSHLGVFFSLLSSGRFLEFELIVARHAEDKCDDQHGTKFLVSTRFVSLCSRDVRGSFLFEQPVSLARNKNGSSA